MWERKDYEQAAAKIGTDFVSSNGEVSIDDLSAKVAEDANLSPDEIRTVVRLANVAVFENKFAKSAASTEEDRMQAGEFPVGDPEKVIQKVHQNVKVAYARREAETGYNQVTDLYGDFFPPREKTAGYENEDEESGETLEEAITRITSGRKKSEEGESAAEEAEEQKEEQEKKSAALGSRLLFKRAEERIRQSQLQEKMRWENLTKQAARTLVSQDGRVAHRTAFEKDAVAQLGVDIIPELTAVHTLTSKSGSPVSLFGGEKLASVQERHIAVPNKQRDAVFSLLKQAQKARNEYTVHTQSLQWLDRNVPKAQVH